MAYSTKEDVPPIVEKTAATKTEMEFCLYREQDRWKGDNAHHILERRSSGNLSDDPDDGGPRATSSPPAKLR